MSSDSPKPPRKASAEFLSALGGGASGAVESVANVVRPSNYPHAARQAGQLADAVTHPSQTANSLHDAFKVAREDMDVPRTGARTAGDMMGGFAVLALMTMAGTAALRRPYLGSRMGVETSRMYGQLPALQNPVMQHPRVSRFLLTRPLAFGVGALVGAAAFIGGARARALTADENRSAHPRVTRALQPGHLEELTATPVSRIAKAKQ